MTIGDEAMWRIDSHTWTNNKLKTTPRFTLCEGSHTSRSRWKISQFFAFTFRFSYWFFLFCLFYAVSWFAWRRKTTTTDIRKDDFHGENVEWTKWNFSFFLVFFSFIFFLSSSFSAWKIQWAREYRGQQHNMHGENEKEEAKKNWKKSFASDLVSSTRRCCRFWFDGRKK